MDQDTSAKELRIVLEEAEKSIKEALGYLESSMSLCAATVLDQAKRKISIKLRGYP